MRSKQYLIRARLLHLKKAAPGFVFEIGLCIFQAGMPQRLQSIDWAANRVANVRVESLL